jgi:hypothetical protein
MAPRNDDAGSVQSKLQNDVTIFDSHRHGLRLKRSACQFLADFHDDGNAARARCAVAPGLAGLDLEQPAMPRASHHLATLDQPILAWHIGHRAADDVAATDRGPFMRATIDQGVEGVVDVLDTDLAARGADDLALTLRDLACQRNDVLRHQPRP